MKGRCTIPAKFAGQEAVCEHLPNKPRRCMAQAKGTGLRCNLPCVTGKSTCQMHGGKSRSGVASGRFKNGTTSKYGVPKTLAERVEKARNNPDLGNLERETAAVNLRIDELATEMDVALAGTTSSRAPVEIWAEIRECSQEKGKLLLAEAKLKRWLGMYVSAEEVRVDRQGCLGIIKQALSRPLPTMTDIRDALNNIQSSLNLLWGLPGAKPVVTEIAAAPVVIDQEETEPGSVIPFHQPSS